MTLTQSPLDHWPTWIGWFGPVLLAGLVLLFVALRGWRLWSKPACRSCGEDMRYRVPDDVDDCPKCGAAVHRFRGMRATGGRPYLWLACVALLMLALPWISQSRHDDIVQTSRAVAGSAAAGNETRARLTILIAPVVGAGLMLLVFSRTAGRRWISPHCGKCDHDLRYLASSEYESCPECGSDVTTTRGVHHYQPRISWWMIALTAVVWLWPICMIAARKAGVFG